MSMVNPSAFYDLVRPELPGIAQAMLDVQIVQAARQFCEKARAWREVCLFQDTEPARTLYPLASHYGEPVQVLLLSVNGDVLWAREGAEETEFARHDPPFRLTPDLGSIVLDWRAVPAAGQVDGLRVYCALRPAVNAALVPRVLYTRHAEAMRLLILGRLMVMAKKPWTDTQLGAAYLQQAAAEAMRAANFIAMGDTRAPMTTLAADALMREHTASEELEEMMGSQNLELILTTETGEGAALQRVGTMWNYAMTVKGTGTVSATVRVEVAYEPAGPWFTWGTMTASGTSSASDSLPTAEGVYAWQRAVVTEATGQVRVIGAGR